jgi:hypothetical protein
MESGPQCLPLRESGRPSNNPAIASSSDTPETAGTAMETCYLLEGLQSNSPTTAFNNVFTPLGRDSKIKTRVMIMSDTWDGSCIDASGHFLDRKDDKATQTFTLVPCAPPVDVLIHCGNFSKATSSAEYFATLDALEKFTAERKLFVPASDDIPVPKNPRDGRNPYDIFYSKLGYRPNDASPNRFNPDTKSYGSINFLEEGAHVLTLKNGGILQVYVSPYSPGAETEKHFEYDEEEQEDRFGCAPVLIPPLVDVLVTRCAPYGVLDEDRDGENTGCYSLLRASNRVRPQVHCFGGPPEAHGLQLYRWDGNDPDENEPVTYDFKNQFPESFDISSMGKLYENGVFKGHETYMVNASIRDPEGRVGEWNQPWILDLYLHRPLYLERPQKSTETCTDLVKWQEPPKASKECEESRARMKAGGYGPELRERIRVTVAAFLEEAQVGVKVAVTIKIIE